MGSKIEQAMADRTELRMLGSPALALSVGEIEASAVWKGENESDPELVENYDTDPLTWVRGIPRLLTRLTVQLVTMFFFFTHLYFS